MLYAQDKRITSFIFNKSQLFQLPIATQQVTPKVSVLKQVPFCCVSQFHGLTRAQLGSSSSGLTCGLSCSWSQLWLWIECLVLCGFCWGDAWISRAFIHDLCPPKGGLNFVHGSSDLRNGRNRSCKAFLVPEQGSPSLSLPLHCIWQSSHRPDSREADISSTSLLEEGHVKSGIVWHCLWRLSIIMASVHFPALPPCLPSFIPSSYPRLWSSHKHLLSSQLLVPNHYIHCYKQESGWRGVAEVKKKSLMFPPSHLLSWVRYNSYGQKYRVHLSIKYQRRGLVLLNSASSPGRTASPFPPWQKSNPFPHYGLS